MNTLAAHSFPPLIGTTAHTLILGTMPGLASLDAVQYYAHPRNALWPIMCALIDGASPTLSTHQTMDYAERSALLTSHGYALWDVLSSCDRAGSLDAKIVRSSEVPNDIARLVQKHPELRCIACNGKTAETLFKRHCKDIDVDNDLSGTIRILSLPSTSPAMATLNLDEKHQRWKEGLLG